MAIAKGKDNIHSLLIERRGSLVAELYRRGPDRPITHLYGLGNPFKISTEFDSSTLHDVRSVSKSIVSLIYGIELAKHRAPILDASVVRTYPDLSSKFSVQDAGITYQHLLTMSSGLLWDEWGKGLLSSDETRLYWTSDLARFVLERPLSRDPGTTFNYNGGGTTLLADALVRATGKTLLQLSREDLFEPLGVSAFEWATDLHNRELPFAGLRLRPRDMLKIGRLLNDHGRWKGHQVVPESWIAESIRPRMKTGIRLLSLNEQEVSYGYQWWIGRAAIHNRTVEWIAAIGNGGQRILAVPALDLSVVLTAGDYGSASIQLTENEILKKVLALIDDKEEAPTPTRQ